MDNETLAKLLKQLSRGVITPSEFEGRTGMTEAQAKATLGK